MDLVIAFYFDYFYYFQETNYQKNKIMIQMKNGMKFLYFYYSRDFFKNSADFEVFSLLLAKLPIIYSPVYFSNPLISILSKQLISLLLFLFSLLSFQYQHKIKELKAHLSKRIFLFVFFYLLQIYLHMIYIFFYNLHISFQVMHIYFPTLLLYFLFLKDSIE